MPIIKSSYGLICAKRIDNVIKFLMIRKTFTYAYKEFVFGHYQKNNEKHLRKLFDLMSYSEKIDILTLNFKHMWFKIYLNNDMSKNKYLIRKNKFEKNFLRDNGKKIKHLIENSKNNYPLWEFPKGRKNSYDENNIIAAKREFSEETMINDINIFYHLPKYTESYNDFGIIYKNIYYLCTTNESFKYSLKNKHQYYEVADIKWVSIQQLEYLEMDPRVYLRFKKLFKKMIKIFKNKI